MNNIVLGYVLVICLELAIPVMLEFISTRIKSSEIRRKISHVSTFTILWLVPYTFLRNDTIHLIICSILYLLVASYLQFAGFVNIHRENGNDNDKATMLGGIAVVILSILVHINNEQWLAFGLGIFAVAIGDAAAALVGVKYGKYSPKIPGVKCKSLIGTLAFIIIGAIGMYVPALIMGVVIPVWKMLILSTIGSIVEVYSKDYDNLLIPITVALVSIILI